MDQLEELLELVDETSTWLIGYCCSYRGPDYGQRLRKLLANYRGTNGHGQQDPEGTTQGHHGESVDLR